MIRRPFRRGLVGALALGALLLVVARCGDDGMRSNGGDEPSPVNVVLVVIDTLRADHLGCYGYERNTSPFLDRFASSATRYTRAISSAPWTVPTHASLFTGLAPFEHGARTFPVDRPSKNVNPLPSDRVTLAEALREHGYRTAAFVSNVAYLAPHWKLDQGFDSYHVERVYADVLNQRILRWLDSATSEPEPFFLFVNYIDVHRPYNTAPRPEVVELPEQREPNELLDELIRRVMPGTEPAPRDLVRKVIAQYDTAIANVDEALGALLERFASDERTAVIVTSDHGEYFGEHRLVEHSKDVYQPALWVPLIARAPGQREAAIVDVPIVSQDVANLVASWMHDPLRGALQAQFPDRPGDHLVLAENYFSRRKDVFHPEWGWRFQRVRRAVFDWPYKYIDSSDGRHELYDLDRDPDEARNLVEDEPRIAARLAAELARILEERDPGEIVPDLAPVGEAQRRRLEALGYVDEED